MFLGPGQSYLLHKSLAVPILSNLWLIYRCIWQVHFPSSTLGSPQNKLGQILCGAVWLYKANLFWWGESWEVVAVPQDWGRSYCGWDWTCHDLALWQCLRGRKNRLGFLFRLILLSLVFLRNTENSNNGALSEKDFPLQCFANFQKQGRRSLIRSFEGGLWEGIALNYLPVLPGKIIVDACTMKTFEFGTFEMREPSTIPGGEVVRCVADLLYPSIFGLKKNFLEKRLSEEPKSLQK